MFSLSRLAVYKPGGVDVVTSIKPYSSWYYAKYLMSPTGNV